MGGICVTTCVGHIAQIDRHMDEVSTIYKGVFIILVWSKTVNIPSE